MSKNFKNIDFTVTEIGSPPQQSTSPLAASVAAARVFFENNGEKEVTLFISGGIDSECMLISFIQANIPFKVVHIRFKNDLNRLDYDDFCKMCQKYSLKPKVIDFDIIDFYESGRHFALAEKYGSRSPQFTAHFEFLKFSEGPALMPWQPLKVRNENGRPSLILPNDNFFSYNRFITETGITASPYFFLYTTELIASFLNLPTSKNWLQQTEFSYYNYKVAQYKQGGFDVAARRNKYTGFELVKEYYQKLYPDQFDPFNEIYRKPLELQNPIPYTLYKYDPRYLLNLIS